MREVDVFKKLWKEFLENETELGFEKAKAIYIKKYKELDMYKVEASRIKENIDKQLAFHNEQLKEIGAKEIEFKLNVKNINKLVDVAQDQTVNRVNDTRDVTELKNIHKRGTLISAGKKVQEVSSYVNLLLNNEIRTMAINNTTSFAKEIGNKVVVVNTVHVPNEICDDYIGNTYDADDDGNLPTYHPNCKCTVDVVFNEIYIGNATWIGGNTAIEYSSYRDASVRYDRLIRQKQRLGESTTELKSKQKEVQDKADELINQQKHLTKRQKETLGFDL